MTDLKATVLIATLVAAAAVLAGCGGGEPAADSAATVTSHGDSDLSWEHDWDDAFAAASRQDKVVLANFEADWCVWCRRLETTTYADDEVAASIDRVAVPLNLDVDGAGKELSETYGVSGLPTVVVFAADGRELGRIDGYWPPEGFLERLDSILGTRG